MDKNDFSNFQDVITKHIYTDEANKAYQRAIYNQILSLKIREKNRNIITDAAQRHSGHEWDHDHVNLIKRLRTGETAPHKAIAIHFAFHVEKRWQHLAKKIDELCLSKFEGDDFFWIEKDPKRDVVQASGSPVYHADEALIFLAGRKTPNIIFPTFIERDDNDSWLNPLNHHAISLFGRHQELNILSEFLHSDSPFSILAVIGPSGSGKTRLATEWLGKHVDQDNWDAGFVADREATPWQNWEPTNNTLIIIDYIFQYDRIIREIVKTGLKSHPYKVRLLVIDHIFPQSLRELPADPFLRSIAETRSEIDVRKRLFHESSPLLLSKSPDREDILADIIAHVSDLPLEGDRVQNALRSLESMGDAACHPLFAALMGEALKQGRHIQDWRRTDLIGYYLNSRNRLPWLDSSDPSLRIDGLHVGGFIATATARRGITFRALVDHTLDHVEKSNQNLSKIFSRCLRIVSSDAVIEVDSHLKPFEPDILGESFFIQFFQEIAHENAYRNWFGSLLTAEDEDNKFELDDFISFFERLGNNLRNDVQADAVVAQSWSVITDFLTPHRFPGNGKLRNVISVAIPYVAETAFSANRPNISEKLLKSFVADNVFELCTGDTFPTAIFSLLMFWDMAANLDGIEVDQNQFKKHLLRYCQGVFSGFPSGEGAIYVAIVNNYPNVLRAIINKSEINMPMLGTELNPLMIAAGTGSFPVVQFLINAGADARYSSKNDGRTALMDASYAGHADIVKYLIDHGALADAAATDTGATPLMMACENGHAEVAQILLHQEVDINRVMKDGASALSLACHNGHYQLAKLLLENDADPDALTANHQTVPLIYAAQRGHIEIVQLLVDRGAQIDRPDSQKGSTALMAASETGQYDVVDFLLSRGADVNAARSDNGVTALMVASECGHIDIVKRLLGVGASVNQQRTDDATTALHWACVFGRYGVIQELLAAGADVDHPRADGMTPLMTASFQGYLPIVRLLIENSANIDANGARGENALYFACQEGLVPIVEYLIAKGADANVVTLEHGQTPLIAASDNGHLGAVKALLRCPSIKIDKQRNDDEITALGIACHRGHNEIVRELLAAGADITLAHSEHNITPLIAATMKNYKDIVLTLLSHHLVDVDAATDDGTTALMLAATCGEKAIVDALIDAGANVNAVRSSDGMTALMFACQHNHKELVRYLLNIEHIDLNAQKTDSGATALLIASERGHQPIVRHLLKAGADPNIISFEDRSPLFQACCNGYTGVSKELLQAGANPNERARENRQTPLFAAIASRKPPLVYSLIQKGADVNAINGFGSYPILQAIISKCFDVVDVLISNGANLNPEIDDALSPLSLACAKAPIEVVNRLLASGANPNPQKIQSKISPLACACSTLSIDVVAALKRKGAVLRSTELDEVNKWLISCVSQGDLNKSNILLLAGADPNYEHDGRNTLITASLKGDIDLLRLLIEFGGDPNKRAIVGKQSDNEPELFDLFQQGFAITNDGFLIAFKQCYVTPVIAAIIAGHPFVLRYLTEQGGNLDFIDVDVFLENQHFIDRDVVDEVKLLIYNRHG